MDRLLERPLICETVSLREVHWGGLSCDRAPACAAGWKARRVVLERSCPGGGRGGNQRLGCERVVMGAGGAGWEGGLRKWANAIDCSFTQMRLTRSHITHPKNDVVEEKPPSNEVVWRAGELHLKTYTKVLLIVVHMCI